MGNSNKKKNETLGMPYGTATHRLRKNILFSLLCRLKENVCFKCKKPIEAVEELSVEHKKPWEGRSADLFWDLGNIAFSHLGCNRPDQPYFKTAMEVPVGMGWCYRCKQFKRRDAFHGNISHGSRLNSECKECKSKLNAQRVRKRPSDNGSPLPCQGRGESSISL